MIKYKNHYFITIYINNLPNITQIIQRSVFFWCSVFFGALVFGPLGNNLVQWYIIDSALQFRCPDLDPTHPNSAQFFTMQTAQLIHKSKKRAERCKNLSPNLEWCKKKREIIWITFSLNSGTSNFSDLGGGGHSRLFQKIQCKN